MVIVDESWDGQGVVRLIMGVTKRQVSVILGTFLPAVACFSLVGLNSRQ